MNRQVNFDSYSAKRISYILSTKNRAVYLEKALKRCRKLVGKDDQLIIADGGSTDRTKSIIKRYQDLVDVFICENDKNPTHALNKGILLAQGRYIKNLNDDDIIYPEQMEKAIRIMDKHPEIDLLICGGTKQRGKTKMPFYVPPNSNYGLKLGDVFTYGSCGVGFIIRRNSFAFAGLFPTSVISDNSVVLEFIAKGMNVKFCRINLFNHPIFSHSFVNVKKNEIEKESELLMQKYCGWKFLLRHRIKKFINVMVQKFPLTRLFLFPAILFKKSNLKINSDIKWDGGFS